ncbi:MAG: hypothetical protein ACREFY_12530 [Acetobacteraceae bacterium]
MYAASKIQPAAVIVEHRTVLVEHATDWAAARSPAEARYLTTILNSETARERLVDTQPKGRDGARHFDNLI